jgi:hypothetical protein
MKRVHTFTPKRTRASKQRNLAVEPCSRPPTRALAFNGDYQLHPMTSVTVGVEVDAPYYASTSALSTLIFFG